MAKWRIGDATRSVDDQSVFRRAYASALLRARLADGAGRRDSGRDRSSAGFTLIELVIVVGVMPLVIGAIAVGMISVFTLQSSVSARLTDSGDAQVVSVNYQNDVQSASMITTANAPNSAPAPCEPPSGSGSGFQLLGLQLGNGKEISYVAAQASSGTAYDLFRNVCGSGSTVPTSSVVIARDLPSSIVQPVTPPMTPPVTITCTTSSTTCAVVPPANNFAYQSDWQSTLGVTAVTFKTTAPASKFSYQLVATPIAGSNSSQLAQVPSSSTGCGPASSGTGLYTPGGSNGTLCFVDFAPWNSQTAASGSYTCDPAQSSSFSNPLPMSAAISGSPFTLDFCMSVSAVQADGHTAITGPTSAGPNCGVAARSGWDDITASPLPTYACPPNSEAFLGNNGFYTGVAGDPALYEVDNSSKATINITNITLLNSNGSAATNWQLVTGDAESTDPGETISWSTNNALIPLNLLSNSTASPVGNACNQIPPSYGNTTYLTGLGTKSVTCTTTNSTDKTGTVMLKAQTPGSLTVYLGGGGLQAMFLGVLLP